MFDTFEENALAKARYFHARTGRPTVADDSGLAVDALGGGPGVLSKRWSGRADLAGQALDDENNRLLLERLRGVDGPRARYVCAAAFVDGRREVVCRGEVHGSIVDEARGAHGFGYDPYFVSSEIGADVWRDAIACGEGAGESSWAGVSSAVRADSRRMLMESQLSETEQLILAG